MSTVIEDTRRCDLTRGSGRPVVLVHGAWVDTTSWRFVTASHRAVRYLSDQRAELRLARPRR